MDPTAQAFLVEAIIYLVSGTLIFLLGLATGLSGKAKATRRAADQAWRMSEIRNRYSDQP